MSFSVVLDDGGAPIAGRAKVVRQIAESEAQACGLAAGLRPDDRRDEREPIACAGSRFSRAIERRAEQARARRRSAGAARRTAGGTRGLAGYAVIGGTRSRSARAARERRCAGRRRSADRCGLAAAGRGGDVDREPVLGAKRSVRDAARRGAPRAAGDRPAARSGRLASARDQVTRSGFAPSVNDCSPVQPSRGSAISCFGPSRAGLGLAMIGPSHEAYEVSSRARDRARARASPARRATTAAADRVTTTSPAAAARRLPQPHGSPHLRLQPRPRRHARRRRRHHSCDNCNYNPIAVEGEATSVACSRRGSR